MIITIALQLFSLDSLKKHMFYHLRNPLKSFVRFFQSLYLDS